jgi:hypothetical protein
LRQLPAESQREYVAALADVAERGTDSTYRPAITRVIAGRGC